MRFFFTLASIFITATMYLVEHPSQWVMLENRFAHSYTSLVYEKSVTIRGLSLIDRQDIEALLPVERSIPWWLSHRSIIEGLAKQNPLVEKASLSPCSSMISGWGCFTLTVTEKQPQYLATLHGEAWLVEASGVPIVPVSSAVVTQKVLSVVSEKNSPVLAPGLPNEDLSPDLVRGRLQYMSKGVKVIEAIMNRRVQKAELTRDGEMVIRFHGLPLSATFDFDGDKPDRLAEEAQRLRILVNRFGTRSYLISTVDLAFDKLAVVRTVDTSLQKK